MAGQHPRTSQNLPPRCLRAAYNRFTVFRYDSDSERRVRDAALRDAFNSGLKTIRKNGTYAAVYSKFNESPEH